MLTVIRIQVVFFGSLIVAAFLLHIYDPGLGYSTPYYPTRKQAIADGILPFVYAMFLFLSPSAASRKLPLWLCAISARGIGGCSILFAVAKILWRTNGDLREMLLTFIITSALVAGPAILAVVELFLPRPTECEGPKA